MKATAKASKNGMSAAIIVMTIVVPDEPGSVVPRSVDNRDCRTAEDHNDGTEKFRERKVEQSNKNLHRGFGNQL